MKRIEHQSSTLASLRERCFRNSLVGHSQSTFELDLRHD